MLHRSNAGRVASSSAITGRVGSEPNNSSAWCYRLIKSHQAFERLQRVSRRIYAEFSLIYSINKQDDGNRRRVCWESYRLPLILDLDQLLQHARGASGMLVIIPIRRCQYVVTLSQLYEPFKGKINRRR